MSNQPYATVAAGGAKDVDRAVAAATAAFTGGPWPDLPARARAAILNRIADGIEARAARIAQLETFDAGLPITQARGQAARAAENFRFFADMAVTLHEDAFRSGTSQFGYVIRRPAALYLRGYDELTHHNLILRQGREPAAARLAYRVRTPADLDLAEAFFAALGARTARVPAGVTPGVGEAVRAEDPLGFTVEFFFDATYVERLQQRYDLRRGAEPARLDHFNIVVPDVRAAYEYYTSLGFGLSETIEDEQTLYAAWMFRKQTVHDVALTGGEGPRLHHLGFFAHESHHVLRICDILGSLHEEFLIERGPGLARGVQRLLRVPAGPGRPPGGDLHQRLLHRRPRAPGAALVGARPAAPGLLGPPGGPVLVHRGHRRARPGRPPAPAAGGKAGRRGHRGRGRLYPVTPVNAATG